MRWEREHLGASGRQNTRCTAFRCAAVRDVFQVDSLLKAADMGTLNALGA